MKKILVIATGGTIDAEPYEVTPINVTPLEHTILPKALEILGLSEQCDVHEVCMKDSKYTNDDDMFAVGDIINAEKDNYDGFVVTMGTDIMVERMSWIKSALDHEDISVALTGAMQPLLNGEQPTSAHGRHHAQSDGWDNLHYAVTHIGKQPPGVYLAFHRSMHKTGEVEKDFANSEFRPKGMMTHEERLESQRVSRMGERPL